MNDQREINNSSVNMAIMLSNQCNLQCSYCIESSKNTHSVISFENIINQLSNIEDHAVIEFTGGEPLLHIELIMKVIEWANNHGRQFFWAITTNGQIKLDEIFIDKYFSKFYSIRISIDGPREVHNLNRGKGSFEHAIDFLKILHAKEIYNIYLNPTFTKETIRNLFHTTQWFLDIQKEFDLPKLKFNLNIADKIEWTTDDYLIYEKQLEHILTWYVLLSKDDKKYFSLECLERAYTNSTKFMDHFTVCSAGVDVFALSPGGELVPCLTDLFDGGIPSHPVLSDFSDENKYSKLTISKDYPECFICDRYQCSPCPSLFKMMTGDMKKIPDNFCKFGKVTDATINRFIQHKAELKITHLNK